MDVDISVILKSDSRLALHEMPGDLRSKVKEKDGNFVMRVVHEHIDLPGLNDLSWEIIKMLSSHEKLIESIDWRWGRQLRVGIFYNLKETVVFPFRLSSSVLQKIASLNLDLSVTGYPCAEDMSNSTD